MGDYKSFLNEADSYYRIIDSNMKKNKKLGNKVLFSISSMVIEKYLVAVLISEGVAVNGHSISSLVAKTKVHFGMLPDEINQLEEIDRKLDLCSFNAVSYDDFNDNDMLTLYNDLVFLKNYVHNRINKNKAA